MASGTKFWTHGFVIVVVLCALPAIPGGLYFALIAGLTEASNPVGQIFALIGLVLLAAPLGLLVARLIWVRSRR